MFLAIASLLWSFTMFEKPGQPICLDEYEGTSGRTPVPYNVQLVPRHAGVVSLAEQLREVPSVDL